MVILVEYKTLYEISTLLNSEQNIHSLLRLAIDKVLETSKAQRGMILVRWGTELDFVCARNADKTDIEQPKSEISKTIINSVLDSGKIKISDNALNDPNFQISSSVRELNLLSIACAPLKFKDETFGVIYIDNRSLASLFDESTSLLLDELSTIISIPIRNALNRHQLLEQQQDLITRLHEQKGYDQIIGKSPAIVKLLDLVDQVADTDAPVLISGESGTGKELIARQLHQKSSRCENEMIVLDCSTIADNLIEAELFGHEKGAFTGADKSKPGWFEVADKSSLFLDEIGELPLAAQKKLLRLIQFGEFTPVGSKKTKKVDVRLIAATNRDMSQMVKEGLFRQDLYYRINVIELKIPPLRERREDILSVATYFLKRFAKENKKTIMDFTQGAKEVLQRHDYPGNIRELRNIIHYAVIMCKTDTIGTDLLPIEGDMSRLHLPSGEQSFKTAKQIVVQQFEKAFIMERLKESNGNITRAAEIAGMYKKNFIDKVKLYGIDVKDFKSE